MHYQTNLIEDEDILQAPAAAVGSTLALGALKFDATQLSPAQKRFNQLLAQTETLAKKIASARQWTPTTPYLPAASPRWSASATIACAKWCC